MYKVTRLLTTDFLHEELFTLLLFFSFLILFSRLFSVWNHAAARIGAIDFHQVVPTNGSREEEDVERIL